VLRGEAEPVVGWKTGMKKARMADATTDPYAGPLFFEEKARKMPSFKAITQDSLVTDEELIEQRKRVASLLEELGSQLSPEQQQLAESLFCELEVFSLLRVIKAGRGDPVH
jgi:hypothetical protein